MSDLREYLSKTIIEADRDWNGNVSQYRQHLVDRIIASGLFTLSAPGRTEEAGKLAALALVIKAKLEAVESGITAFEDEFLAHIVMPDGQTVGAHIKPRIAQVYESGNMMPLLPPPRADT